MALTNSSRGFFFTVMALALLSFMLLTVQVWVRTFEQYDQRTVQRFKGEAVQQILSVVSDKSMSNFANASAFFATYSLAEYSSVSGLPEWAAGEQQSNPYTGAVEQSIRQLMLNGTVPEQLTGFSPYSDGEYASYTIESWQNRVRASAGVMGFSLNFSEVKNFAVRQIDPWTVGVHFEIGMNITDLEGTMFQSRNLTADSSFTIDGFPDPLVRRRSAAEGHANVGRQVFRTPVYTSPDSAKPASWAGTRGAGWFFGPVRYDYPGQGENTSQYVLVHQYDDNLTGYMDLFGAVVLTDTPRIVSNETLISGCRFRVENETRCINCRVTYAALDAANASKPQCAGVRAPDTDLYNRYAKPYVAGTGGLSLPTVPLPTQQSYVLVDNWNDYIDPLETRGLGQDSDYPHKAWDLTPVRDMAICGQYVHAAEGPSFFQRMVGGQHSSPDYGIESFVIGQWAGGAEDQSRDQLSRLDWEFYSGQAGGKVKGMMGCKTPEMCRGEAAVKESVGHFGISATSAGRYGLTYISCDYSGPHAGC